MDSFTQIVLGAGMGEIALGKKVGNKAMLWGAIAGTIPDLDVIAGPFMSDIQALAFHRGISHSLVFTIGFAPILGFIITQCYKKKDASWLEWSWLSLLGLVTHPLLDCFTTFGTQLFLPFSDYRVAFNSIFIVDPIYTLPFFFCLIVAACLQKKSPARHVWAWTGVIVSSLYLIFTLGNKVYINYRFDRSLEAQKITYTRMMSTPTPFNNILWTGIAEGKDNYYVGNYSWFDKKTEIDFKIIPHNHSLIAVWDSNYVIRKLKWFSNDYYCITRENKEIVFNDLRFGKTSISNEKKDPYVYAFNLIKRPNGNLDAEKRDLEYSPGKKDFQQLWLRIKGNNAKSGH